MEMNEAEPQNCADAAPWQPPPHLTVDAAAVRRPPRSCRAAAGHAGDVLMTLTSARPCERGRRPELGLHVRAHAAREPQHHHRRSAVLPLVRPAAGPRRQRRATTGAAAARARRDHDPLARRAEAAARDGAATVRIGPSGRRRARAAAPTGGATSMAAARCDGAKKPRSRSRSPSRWAARAVHARVGGPHASAARTRGVLGRARRFASASRRRGSAPEATVTSGDRQISPSPRASARVVRRRRLAGHRHTRDAVRLPERARRAGVLLGPDGPAPAPDRRPHRRAGARTGARHRGGRTGDVWRPQRRPHVRARPADPPGPAGGAAGGARTSGPPPVPPTRRAALMEARRAPQDARRNDNATAPEPAGEAATFSTSPADLCRRSGFYRRAERAGRGTVPAEPRAAGGGGGGGGGGVQPRCTQRFRARGDRANG